MSDAEHELASINTLVVIALLAICLWAAYLIKKHRFYYLPESAAAMLVGMLLGGVVRLAVHDSSELNMLRFKPELFFFLLLPPIIFEAGYTLKRKRFFANFGSIVLYAVMGTILSTFVIGMVLFEFGSAGVIDVNGDSPLQALLFGALISAVDPVATLSIMGSPELNCDPLLYSLVFGESVLNDAVAIVLFKTFAQLTERNAIDLNNWTSYLLLVGEFLGISIGSIVVGVTIGLLASALCRHTDLKKYPHKEIVVLFLVAYTGYAAAEAATLSGIMSLFFLGIVLSHYNWHNLSDASKVSTHHIFKGFAMTTETVVFAYMGMSLFSGQFTSWSPLMVVLSILCCFAGRVVNIVPLSFLANLKRRKRIPGKMQFIMWFAGLRGAIAFALALNMPNMKDADGNDKWNNDVIVTTTQCIVIFTTVVCGGLTEPMLSRMGMKRGDAKAEDSDEADMTAVLKDDEDDLNESLTGAQTPSRSSRYSGIHLCWKRFDTRYMQPWFGRPKRKAHLATEMATRRRPKPAAHGDYTQVDDDGDGDTLLASPFPASSGDSKATPHSLSAPSWHARMSGNGGGSAGRGIGGGTTYAPPSGTEGDLGSGSGDFFGGTPPTVPPAAGAMALLSPDSNL